MNLAVGFFDGVHLGHRRILAQADVALTFRNHPATVFAPSAAPRLLMTAETRRAVLATALRPGTDLAAADRVRMLDFTPAFAALSPEAFAASLRRDFPTLETIFCGPNWTFGAKGAGTADFLRARGFHVDVVSFAEQAGRPISSTRIRQAIASGDWADATACLGRPWRVEGVVASGKGLGRELGFPTLNVQLDAALVEPPRGVYAVRTPWGAAVANWGCAPTLGARAWTMPVLEVHLLEAKPTETPAVCTVDFCAFLRSERTFPSLAALQAQIADDLRAARTALGLTR